MQTAEGQLNLGDILGMIFEKKAEVLDSEIAEIESLGIEMKNGVMDDAAI